MYDSTIAHRDPRMGEHLTTVLDVWLDHSSQRPPHGWTSYHSTEHMTGPVIAQTPPHGQHKRGTSYPKNMEVVAVWALLTFSHKGGYLYLTRCRLMCNALVKIKHISPSKSCFVCNFGNSLVFMSYSAKWRSSIFPSHFCRNHTFTAVSFSDLCFVLL